MKCPNAHSMRIGFYFEKALKDNFKKNVILTLCTRGPKIRLLCDASAARKPKFRLSGLPIIKATKAILIN